MGDISDEHHDQMHRDREEYLESDDYRYGDGGSHRRSCGYRPAASVKPKPAAVRPVCSRAMEETFLLVYAGEQEYVHSWFTHARQIVDATGLDERCIHRCLEPFRANARIQGVECEHGIRVIDGQRPNGRILKVSGCGTVRCQCLTSRSGGGR